jgi:phosphoribosylaminoimidazole-succinocarboxamide synthase
LLLLEGITVLLTSTDIPQLTAFTRGKVRDVYDLDYQLLMIATDRISAFDVVLPTAIPEKGQVLTQLSVFWFETTQNVAPNHFLTADPAQIEAVLKSYGADVDVDALAGRAMLVNKCSPLPVECVVRGYLAGSAWEEYRRTGRVTGITLPPGLVEGDRLPEPIFTPATKAREGHDINITWEEMLRIVEPGHAQQARDQSLALYATAADYARERGIIIADTKFEFGIFQGMTIVIDEVLTPDSSRFWDAASYRPGGPQPSFDKQFVRDYLVSSQWNRVPPAPTLPPEIVERTTARYLEAYRRLVGKELD